MAKVNEILEDLANRAKAGNLSNGEASKVILWLVSALRCPFKLVRPQHPLEGTNHGREEKQAKAETTA